MVTKRLFRYGGIAALLSTVLYIASLAIMMSAGGTPSTMGTALYTASSVCFLITAYALFTAHRQEAASLSLSALLAAGIGTVAGLFIDTAQITPVWMVSALLWSEGLLAYGWLGYRSPQLPTGASIGALIAGGLGIILGIAGIFGISAEMIGLLNLILSVPYLVWLLWLARFWLMPRSALALG